jgi:hypothetical protein
MKPLRSKAVEQTTLSSPLRISAADAVWFAAITLQ